MEIRTIKTSELRPAAYNPRKDLQPGDPEYEKLRRSMEKYGYVEPVIYNDRTGGVVGGHQRLKVLQDMGVAEVQCVVVDLDETDEKALNIALNKISGEWDVPKLADLIAEIDAGDYDVTLTGFDLGEIDALAAQFAPDMEDIDGVKEPTIHGIYMTIDSVKVPMTEEERDAILERLEGYVQKNGVPFGFVGDLLEA